MKANHPTNKPTMSPNHIPDANIIDLEHDGNHTDMPTGEKLSADHDASSPQNDEAYTKKQTGNSPVAKKGFCRFLNLHVLLLVTFLFFVVFLYAKFSNWGERINLSDLTEDYSHINPEVLDQFLPLVDSEGRIVPTGEVDTIVAFGNAPFADDRDSEDNLANLIAEATGATVYNCSISGSYLASQSYVFDSKAAPMDAYCFYWMVCMATMDGINSYYFDHAAEILGDATPPEAQEVRDILTTLDFNTVDVVTVMYDASDYLMGHAMYDDNNSTNIQQFTGNLEAGIEKFQETYPHIRIIVMSPTYAYALDEDGNYVSSDMYVYGDRDVLSTYVIKEFASCSARSVTFVDHLYGTVTEDNATEYLKDHLHLNQKGRELVTQRFVNALTRNGMEPLAK